MRHGLNVVDFQNPKMGRPTVRLEHWIVVRAEMSRDALPVDPCIKHAAHVNARDGTTMHAEPDETARELIQDDQDPVTAEHDRLAAKQVDVPETVSGVADERQP